MTRTAFALSVFALIAVLASPAGAADLFNNTNIAGVSNSPTAPTVFTLASPAQVTELVTYHWNNARGSIPGTIGLKAASGTVFGPFPAIGSAGQGGAPNVNWTTYVNLALPAGTYTIVDSEPATWSQNSQSGHSGFAIVRGTSAGGAEGQGASGGFEYAVKFVCGAPEVPVVAPGQYFTAINVHNPSPRPAYFRKKIAVALPGEKAGRVSRFFEAQLKSDEALEIDCQDILQHAEQKGFLKGFVVIESPLELDVVAVYTAGHPQVETMEIERVTPRASATAQPVTPPPGPTTTAYCPAGASGDPVGNEHCCCNKPKPGGGFWPDCKVGLACYGNLSAPGLPAGTVSVCLTSAFAPFEIHFSQPPFCGQK
jgi:hypothetical protein